VRTAYRVAGLLVVAALLLWSGVAAFPHAGDQPCHTVVVPNAPPSPGGEWDPVAYGSLSAEGQAVFDAALAAPDREVTVYGAACPPDFPYLADQEKTTPVRHDGTNYRVETRGPGLGGVGFETDGLWALGLTAGALVLVVASNWPSLPSGPTLGVAAALGALSPAAVALGNTRLALYIAVTLLAACVACGRADPPPLGTTTVALWAVPAGAFALAEGGLPPGIARPTVYVVLVLAALLVAAVDRFAPG